jgi:hypothetical protein
MEVCSLLRNTVAVLPLDVAAGAIFTTPGPLSMDDVLRTDNMDDEDAWVLFHDSGSCRFFAAGAPDCELGSDGRFTPLCVPVAAGQLVLRDDDAADEGGPASTFDCAEDERTPREVSPPVSSAAWIALRRASIDAAERDGFAAGAGAACGCGDGVGLQPGIGSLSRLTTEKLRLTVRRPDIGCFCFDELMAGERADNKGGLRLIPRDRVRLPNSVRDI